MRLEFTKFAAEFEKISSWLPKNYPADEVTNILANLQVFPKATPTTETALEVYQSKLRVDLLAQASLGYQKQPPATKLQQIPSLQIPEKIAQNSRNPAEALLIFLDGLQPTGVFDVELADFKLATCFCCEGQLDPKKPGALIAEATIDFGIPQKQKLQVIADQLVKIDLRAGFTAEVRVKTFGDFKINSAKKFLRKVTGSEIGLVFDGRGRPITPPGAAGDRMMRTASWKQALAAVAKFAISDF